MSHCKLLAAIAATVAFTGFSAFAADPSADQLQQSITHLKTQIAQLETAQDQGTASVAIIEQVLRDADKRSQFLAVGESGAGHDSGFYIGDPTGTFLLRPGALLQFRHVTDYRANTGRGKDDEIESGFELRRMDLSFDGFAWTRDLRYKLAWSNSADSGTITLDDAYIRYMFADAWGARFGKFKEIWSHEEAAGDSRALAVERSLLDAALGGRFSGRVQGATLIYGGRAKDNPINIEAGLIDGSGSANSSYIGHYPSDPGVIAQFGPPGAHAFDFGVVARAEWRAMGDWADYDDYAINGLKENLLVIGGGLEWNVGGDGDEVAGTIDVQFKHTNGLGIYGGLIVRNINKNLSASGTQQTDWGAVLQISYAVDPVWEPFFRYALVKYDDNIVAANEDAFHEIAVGVNYYLWKEFGYKAKVTVDLNWLPNGAPGSIRPLGYLGDSGGDTEIALRWQLQISL